LDPDIAFDDTADCFLCAPSSELMYLGSDGCFAMLGLGAIVEGYSLVATRAHERSFFDLPAKLSLFRLILVDLSAGAVASLTKPCGSFAVSTQA